MGAIAFCMISYVAMCTCRHEIIQNQHATLALLYYMCIKITCTGTVACTQFIHAVNYYDYICTYISVCNMDSLYISGYTLVAI